MRIDAHLTTATFYLVQPLARIDIGSPQEGGVAAILFISMCGLPRIWSARVLVAFAFPRAFILFTENVILYFVYGFHIS